MSQVFSQNPEAGITEFFHYDDATDQFGIETIQDVTSLVEQNKSLLNGTDEHERYGDVTRVASIPMTLYFDLKAKGIIDDPKKMKAWLNDPENRYFRTRPGVV